MRESIEAIATKHKLEPTLRTVYVEGPTDLIFYKKCLKKLEITNISISDISTVDTTKLDFSVLGLNPQSNRDKVHAFINIIRTNFALFHPFGIIDADFDHIIGTYPSIKGLFHTDTSCKEAYFWDQKEFVDFFDRITKNLFSRHISTVGDSLNAIFALRFINLEYKIPMAGEWYSKSYFTIETGFDYKKYSKNIIVRAGKSKEIDSDEFAEKITTVIKSISKCHIAINGHDMINILINIINTARNTKSISDDGLLLEILQSLDCYDQIIKTPLFISLKSNSN